MFLFFAIMSEKNGKTMSRNHFRVSRVFKSGEIAAIDLEKFHMGQKLKHALISLKIVSYCLSCHKDSKNI